MHINKAIIMGYVGSNASYKEYENGTSVSKFSIATPYFKTTDGNKEEFTNWHNITTWGKLADICNKWIRKGDLVMAEGEIKTTKIESNDGNKPTYYTEIIARNIQFKKNSGVSGKTEEQTKTPENLPF